jgi:hypothetical protein
MTNSCAIRIQQLENLIVKKDNKIAELKSELKKWVTPHKICLDFFYRHFADWEDFQYWKFIDRETHNTRWMLMICWKHDLVLCTFDSEHPEYRLSSEGIELLKAKQSVIQNQPQ